MSYTLDGQVIKPGNPFVDSNGNQYPKNWLEVLSESQRQEIGIVYTPEATSQYYDRRFYWSADNPKDLDTLKSVWVAKQKETASTLLNPTDWYVTRKYETDTQIPTDVTTYRAAVRTSCGARESEINGCTTVDELVVLLTGGVDSTITEWPNLDPEAAE